MKTICPGLRLIMQFMYPAKSFGISIHTLASQSPYKNTEPNNSIGCQLMKVYLKVLQNLPYHVIQGEPKSCSEEALENDNFVLFWFQNNFLPSKPDKLAFSLPEITKFPHHNHVILRYSRLPKLNVTRLCWVQDAVSLSLLPPATIWSASVLEASSTTISSNTTRPDRCITSKIGVVSAVLVSFSS
jgi:hypothetical protein